VAPLEIQQRPAPTAAHYGWAALAMFVLAVYGSLLPFRYAYRPFDEVLAAFSQIKFYDPSNLEARGDWVISTVLFAALSFLLIAALSVDRPRWVSFLAALVGMCACLVLSVAIEFTQIYFPPRTVSLNDIYMESLGGAAGALTWLVGGQRITGWLRRLGKVTTVSALATRILPGYLVALLVVQLMPFDFIVGFDELAVKYAEGKVRLIPWASPELATQDHLVKAALNLVCFFPLGFLQAWAQRRENVDRLRSFPWVMLAVPIIVELLQLFVYSRVCDVADVLTGALGVYCGWRLGKKARSAFKAAPTATMHPGNALGALGVPLFVAWLITVVYLYWRPFDFTADPSRFETDRHSFHLYGFRRLTLAPFADYYWGSKYNALDQFARKALSFVPLGILGALSLQNLYKRRAAAWMLLTAFAIALVLEGGRYFLPSRSPSTTDVLIACAGAWLGFWLTRRFRVVLWAETALYGWMRPSSRRWAHEESLPYA
jgi:VanZ family protein